GSAGGVVDGVVSAAALHGVAAAAAVEGVVAATADEQVVARSAEELGGQMDGAVDGYPVVPAVAVDQDGTEEGQVVDNVAGIQLNGDLPRRGGSDLDGVGVVTAVDH